ncbi:hypothetical protein AU074_13810 [Pseudomonas sp. ATCC PTA-122608]|nr:hypothetical protein AU074_13810 [Pseudomonas sp. ATCC PTA-122608]
MIFQDYDSGVPIKKLDFGNPEPKVEEKQQAEIPRIDTKTSQIIDKLNSFILRSGFASQLKISSSISPRGEYVEGDLLSNHEPVDEVLTLAEHEALNAPEARFEGYTAGIVGSDDDEEQEEQFEEVVAETDVVDEPDDFFDEEEEAPQTNDVHTAVEADADEYVFEDEPYESLSGVGVVSEPVAVESVQAGSEQVAEIKAEEVVDDEPEVFVPVEDLTVPGVQDGETEYESFMPASDITVPPHVEDQFHEILPFLAPPEQEEVQEPGVEASEVFEALVFAPTPIRKPVPTQLERHIRTVEKARQARLTIENKPEHLSVTALERLRVLSDKSYQGKIGKLYAIKEALPYAEDFRHMLETCDFEGLREIQRLLNKTFDLKKQEENSEIAKEKLWYGSYKKFYKD